MPKMNVADAAEHFGVSKEAIHNRIRRGSLQSVVQDGIKFVVVDGSVALPNKTQKNPIALDNRYYKFLEEQNSTLQAKIEKLEEETKTLRDQKEKMLIEEKIKIEEIYLQKDEQLKNILNSLSSKFILNAPEAHTDEHVEAEIEIIQSETESELVSLKRYLKESSLKKNQRKKIKEKIKEIANKDQRITLKGKKIYLNLEKYDYSNLF